LIQKVRNFPMTIYLIMFSAVLFFYFYPPVSFIISDINASQLGNKVILIIFFVCMASITTYSLFIFDKSSKRNLKLFKDVLGKLESRPTLDFQGDVYKVRTLFSHSVLSAVWDKYENTIRRIESGSSDDGEVRVKYYSTIESNCFFNEEVVYSNLSYFKFINYAPQLLTALGIFGTFLGLVIGLLGVDFNDVTNTTNSIKLLLNGVQISFRTSIYGIAFSLILTVYQKILLGNQESLIVKISDKIDSIFPMNTQADGINQLHVELEKQTASIQRMGTEIAESVANKFESSLQNTLGPTLEKFSQTTEQLIEIVKNSNQSTIASLVDNIGTIISSSTSQELERLQSTIGTMAERNESLLSEFEKTIQTLQSLVESQKSVVSETNLSANSTKQMNENTSLLAGELVNIISGLNNFASVQQDSYDGHLELVKNVRETLEQQDKSMALFKETVQQTVYSAEVQKHANEKLSVTVGKLDEFNNNFQSVLDSIKKSVGEFEGASETICNKFNDTMANLGMTHASIGSSMEGLTTGLNQAIKSLDVIVSNDLREINDQYVVVVKNLNGFSEKSDKLVEQLAIFTDTNQGYVQLWGDYKESFDNLNQEINKGVVDYTSNVRQGLQNLFKDYDDHISKVLGEFKATIENFGNSIEELNEILDEKNLEGMHQKTSKIIQDGNTVLKAFVGKMDELKEVYQQQMAAVRMTSR